jgi:class 3 adenylate cyclase
VRAALSIVGVVSAVHTSGHPLAAHIGIASGLVVAGDLLSASAGKEHVVLGETPNLAARLVDLAAPGEVVVSAPTRALIRNAFDLRELAPQLVKGMALPVVATRCCQREPWKAVSTRSRGRNTTLVGRDKGWPHWTVLATREGAAVRWFC